MCLEINEKEAEMICSWASFVEFVTENLDIEGGLNQKEEDLIQKLMNKFPNLLIAWTSPDLYLDRLKTGKQ